MTKIDLAEIEKIQLEFSRGVFANEKSDEQMVWGAFVSVNTAKQIASALEALPKLVEALQNVNGHYNTPIGRRKANEGQLEALQSADYALTLFETTNPANL